MALTDKQERFCQLASVGSYADAYRGAYDPAPGYNHSEAARVLRKNPEIQRRIIELTAAASLPIANAREFLLSWWLYRMTYDPAEISRWAVGACRHCYGDGHGYQWRLHEFMEAVKLAELADNPMPDIAGGFGYNSTLPPVAGCSECDGKGKGRADFADTGDLSPSARAGFEGVKQTKDGLEIRMADKHKAAEQFGKLSGLDVIQVRRIAEEIPDAAELAALALDPEAALNVYKSITGGGSGRKALN
jgi:phage terminase small subunit